MEEPSRKALGRDDFSPEVKRTLAARAGHKWSVCLKATSGPGVEIDSSLSDGIAAHITAASPKGPRFDASISSEQRRSVDNGIWACTQHGREIDSDAPGFSVEVLRGLKRIREDNAARELQATAGGGDPSSKLIELPFAETSYKLFEIVEGQPYGL